MRRLIAPIIAVVVGLGLTGCVTDADQASRNIDTAAEQFELYRRAVFYNGITDSVFLEVYGFCSYDNQGTEIEVICKDEGGFWNHSMGLSDNVTYVVEQLDGAEVSTTRTRVIFKPETLIPNVDRP